MVWVSGLRFRFWGLGFRVESLRLKVAGAGLRVKG